ncbi:MAG: hypothetical protein KIT83_04270 [Bryobacterales bacterium]|nr:hypothetical protein [Bryobacterales bacterium]
MRIAIPTTHGELEEHFGQCHGIALADCDEQESSIQRLEMLDAPAHEHGLLPRWLKQQGVDVVIAGNVGGRAQALLAELEIQVVTGAPRLSPDFLVRSFLQGTLESRPQACCHLHSHDSHDDGHCRGDGNCHGDSNSASCH